MNEPISSRPTVRDRSVVINPSKGKGDPQVDRDALMIMTPSDLQRMVRMCSARALSFSQQDLYGLYAPNPGTGFSCTLSGPFIGAPLAVLGLEKLLALGATRIWTLGWCGSLLPHLCVGDLVLPDAALSEEGTSLHYPLSGSQPVADDGLVRDLQIALERHGASCEKGTVWTTDAPYRETVSKVQAYGERGILAVEMEFSALVTVARYRSVALAGLLVVSDELSGGSWRPGFSSPGFKQAARLACEVLLSAVSLSEKEFRGT